MNLPQQFRTRVVESSGATDGDVVVVALSGGRDSVVLLHLLRFTEGLPRLGVVAAHLDHGMRPDSGRDADWVRGLTRAWGVHLHEDLLAPPPDGEDAARRARYAFLERVRVEVGARLVVTAHHADDQAETVLFRIFRGTGIRGLAGIPEWRGGTVWRPLLPFARREIESYARTVELRWREDPTNADTSLARNAIRHRVLPEAEAGVAPGARRALCRLARIAAAEEEAWRSLTPWLHAHVGVGDGEDGLTVERDRLMEFAPPVRARVLRNMAEALGVRLDEAGTRAALEFTSSGSSGGRVDLAGGVVLGRAFHRLSMRRVTVPSPDRPVIVAEPGTGEARACIGGRALVVRWWTGPAKPGEDPGVVPVRDTSFPLTIRGWVPGDRVALCYGSKKLKKLFAERRVPVPGRARTPVLLDAEGRILWVPGVVRSVECRPRVQDESVFIEITDADDD